MRTLIDKLEQAFIDLHRETVRIVESYPFEELFPQHKTLDAEAPGMLLVRSAAKVEQCFGGLSSRLWDDPFEWTLPEIFTDRSKVVEYLVEVEKARVNGFSMLKNDTDLEKEIIAPGGMKSVLTVLDDTLERARECIASARGKIDS